MERIPVKNDGEKKSIYTTGKEKTDTMNGIVLRPKTKYRSMKTTKDTNAEGNEVKRAVIMKASIASPSPFLKKGKI